jgi:hypothetical protein
MALTFAPANKVGLKARIALEGPAGSGKTWTALTIARALGETIALADTEHRSASKYADLFKFDTEHITRFAPDVLIEILAATARHDVTIIDSFSHFWMGADGMLEQVDRKGKTSPGSNNFNGWKEMRPAERRMLEAMLAHPGHLIVTMRVKSEWVIEDNDKGKKKPTKIGMKPEQREGLDYEFDLVGSMDLENTLTVTKSRCPILNGKVIQKPTEELGRTLLDWLDAGDPDGPTALDLRDQACAPGLTVDELKAIFRQADEHGRLNAAIITDAGDVQILEDFLRAKGVEAQAAARAAARRAAEAGANA